MKVSKSLTVAAFSAAVGIEAATVTDVTFESQGADLAGHFYLPDAMAEGQRLPGVVVTGAWTSVKEQMPAAYAKALAHQGYAVLTFDFRGWGASPDSVSYLEDPKRKTEDIVAAVDYLVTRPEIDSDRIGGLGICASAGYMSDAAYTSGNIQSLALVAPWLHNAEIVEAVYGGAEGVQNLIQLGMEATAAETPVYLEAASTTNENALMFQVPYYTEEDRGLIPQYDNKFNVASWEAWLTYDAMKTAPDLTKPTIIVHSQSAAIPQGVSVYVETRGGDVTVEWIEDKTQFDFYDDNEAVTAAVKAVAKHFEETLKETDKQSVVRDEVAIKTLVESVASLADTGNFESLEKLYADEIKVDYTSLSGGDPEVKSPTALMTQWASTLPGFDTTRHVVSNVRVALDGTEATATAGVVADHFVDDLYWQVTGSYQYRFVQSDGVWKITEHTFHLESEAGTRDVFSRAAANVGTNPPAYLLRQQTQDAVRSFLESLEEKDMEKFASVWADDVVQDMPYSPEGFPRRVTGKANLIAHYAQWPEVSSQADFTSHLVFYPTTDPEMIFAEFRGSALISTTGLKYEQSYGGLFHVENGKIVLFREYFNPVPFKVAFGMES